MRSGGTVFLTSHILDVVEKLCDHAGVISHGKLVAQGPLSELRADAASLEEAVVALIGGGRETSAELLWLKPVP